MDTTFRSKARLFTSVSLFTVSFILIGACIISPLLGKVPLSQAAPSSIPTPSFVITEVKIGNTQLYYNQNDRSAFTNQAEKDVLFVLKRINASDYKIIEAVINDNKIPIQLGELTAAGECTVPKENFKKQITYKLEFRLRKNITDPAIMDEMPIKLSIFNKVLTKPTLSPDKIVGKNRGDKKFFLIFDKTVRLDERVKGTASLESVPTNSGEIQILDSERNKATLTLKDPDVGGDFSIVIPKESIQDIYGNQFADKTLVQFKRANIGPALEKDKLAIEKLILPNTKEVSFPAPSNLKRNQLGTYTVVVKKAESQKTNTIDLDVNGKSLSNPQEITVNDSSYKIPLVITNSGKYEIAARLIRSGTNNEEFVLSDSIDFEVKYRPLAATVIEPTVFGGPRGGAGGTIAIQINFPSDTVVNYAGDGKTLTLVPRDGQASVTSTAITRISDFSYKATFPDPTPGKYFLRLPPGPIDAGFSDVFENTIDTEILLPFERRSATDPSTSASPEVVSNVDPRGLRDRGNGPFVPFHEYTTPRSVPQGFNPDDRVETRVSRLYYYRDAHRVVQILNRKAKSYNRAAVDVQRQVAEKARFDADGKTDKRRSLERTAVQAAIEARAIETQIANLNAQYQNALSDREGRLVKLQSIQGNLTKKSDDLKAERLDLQNRAGQLDNQIKLDTDESTRRTLEKTEHERRLIAERDANLAKFSDDASIDTINKDYKNKKAASDEHYARLGAAASINSQNRKTTLNNANNRINSISTELDAIAQASPTTGIPGSPSEMDALRQSLEQDQANRVEEINNLARKLEGLRLTEIKANEAVINADADETRAREEQFRREVAAAMEDPDTFAPGAPYSYDPVEQVSISVIGEGLIQLRGPMKGINNIRLAINQIDAPVGQTRISVHTIQINGERGDRMEKVSQRIQTYLDQSRFLTTQSGQMLRKAVVKIASEKSMMPIQFQGVQPGSQMERDYRYLVAFFGADFIRELQTLDSEFLRTGNKLLSLHSMDSTSLANALFLIALAKNDVRHEILMEFERLIQCELPVTEQSYITPIALKCDKLLGHKAQYQILSQNARFESLKGFLNAQAADPDGLNPMQREFIRLTQIFKSQLVTELEVKQRVMERAIIEVRLKSGKTIEQVEREQADAEEHAQKAFDRVYKNVLRHKDELLTAALLFAAKAEGNRGQRKAIHDALDAGSQDTLKSLLQTVIGRKYLADLMAGNFAGKQSDKIEEIKAQLKIDIAIDERHKRAVDTAINDISILFGSESLDIFALMKKYTEFRRIIASFGDEVILWRYDTGFTDQVKNLVAELTTLESKSLNLANKRRSLDHKKMLDMLVSEMEDKYVEILEGTRAHTANIDNHLKAIITALDDDFNRQFYQPAFSQLRHASRFYDVTFGQVDTTNVLANNRGFAKVDPQATMEFDLPRRDILIQEALKTGKALVQDYGALLQDPTFLTLGKLGSGSPTSSMAAGTGSALSPVRNVLPGLPGTSSEGILAQQGPGNRELGSALEALIPDPAIYKFETGTGYEIRPVIQPDGQAVVFKFNYMYTTNVREPVRADEKHLGRVKRHFINTDVQLSNYELREVSTYRVALKAARTAKGVPLLEDVPGVGLLFRPLASDESSLQQNQVYAQATIFPTLFDLMGLRWAPAIADMDALRLQNSDFIVRNRGRDVRNRVYDYSSFQVDNFLRIPEGDRRSDYYRSQESLPWQHPNGYSGPGLNLRDSSMREGYNPREMRPDSRYAPAADPEGNERAPRLPIPNREGVRMIPGAPGVTGVSETPGMSGSSGGNGNQSNGSNSGERFNLGSERGHGALGQPVPPILNSPGNGSLNPLPLSDPNLPSRQPTGLPASMPYVPAGRPMNPNTGQPAGEPNKVSSRGREYEAPGLLPVSFTQTGSLPNSNAPAKATEKGSNWGFRGIWGKSGKSAEKPTEKANQTQVVPVGFQQSQPPMIGDSSQPASNTIRGAKTKPSTFAGLFGPAKSSKD